MLEHPQNKGIFAALSSGMIAGVLAITVAAAYASLLYRGAAAAHVSFGFKLILVASAVSAAWATWRSRIAGIIAGPDDSATVVLAGVAVILVGHTAVTQGSTESAALTLALLLAISSVATAVLFYLVGHFRLGNIIRYLPDPVISGFLAGAGLLLFVSGLGLAAATPELSLSKPGYFLAAFRQGWMIVPALIVALTLWYGFRHIEHPLFMPTVLLACTGIFFFALWGIGIDLSAARQSGWLFDFLQVDQSLPLTAWFTEWDQINFRALWSVIPELVSVLFVMSIVMLLQTSGLEKILKQDVDVNKELKQASGANMAAATFAGPPVVPFIGDTALNIQLAGPNRIAGWVLAMVCVLATGISAGILQWLPVFVLAGILMYFGLSLLENSIWKSWKNLCYSDFFLVVLVAVTINVAGFSTGTFLGVALASFIFLHDYSRLPVVRMQFNATTAPSRIDRPHHERRLLAQHPQWLLGLELEGFLFFGSAHHLDKQVANAFAAPAKAAYLILDFRRVQGIDASAVAVFSKIARRVRQKKGKLLFAGLSPTVASVLARVSTELPGTAVYTDLDHALEAAEEDYLNQYPLTQRPPSTDNQPHAGLLSELQPYGEVRRFPADSVLIAKGEAASGVNFILEGSVSVCSRDRMGSPIRLRRFTEGTVIGEISHYLQRPASADVVAGSTLMVFHLSSNVISKLEQKNPELAVRLHNVIATELSQRLVATNQSLQVAIA